MSNLSNFEGSEDNRKYSSEERKKIADFWNLNKNSPPSLSKIVEFFTDGAESDPRTAIGHKVRHILNDLQIKPPTTVHIKREEIVLTDEQKELINNNASKENGAYQLAKTLFPNNNVKPLGKEYRAVAKYIKESNSNNFYEVETIVEGRYEPPTSIQAVLKKVNIYLHEELALQTMTAFDKKCLETTRQFLHAPRFIQEVNNYQTSEKRTSFESEFIRAVYGKPDLTPEEVSLTINWCSDIIQAADIRKLLEQLHNDLNNTGGADVRKHSQALAVTIGEVTTNLNEVLKRQERIYGLLNKSRAKRDEETKNKVGSLTALFEWAAEENNRKEMIRIAKLQEQIREEEIDKMMGMDDTILLSLGLKSDEVIK